MTSSVARHRASVSRKITPLSLPIGPLPCLHFTNFDRKYKDILFQGEDRSGESQRKALAEGMDAHVLVGAELLEQRAVSRAPRLIFPFFLESFSLSLFVPPSQFNSNYHRPEYLLHQGAWRCCLSPPLSLLFSRSRSATIIVEP